MNLRIKTFLILMILLIFISILLIGCSLLRGIIPSLPNKGTSPVHNLIKDSYYNTIQEALDDANSGDTIEVSDGTYDESIIFPSDKIIILQSLNGPPSTIIRGRAGSPTVQINQSSEGTTIDGFTITHNSGDRGRGIYNKYTNAGLGYLSINKCIISGNSASDGGGIMNDGTLTITKSTISGNSASSNGGGIWNWYDSSLTITESTISGNSASSNGGGIMNYGTLTITKSTISDNSATTYNGGGIWNWYLLTITESTISGNSSSWDGGGIYYIYDIYNYDGSLTITGNTICGNYKDGDSPSLDQQIMDSSSGSLYETYKDTNYISAYCGVPSGPVHNLTKDTYYNTIQVAVNAASSGDTIIVGDGTYIENVNIDKDHLIIRSENGAETTIVQAADPKFDVIGVRADYVSISGFTIIGANGESVAGIKLTYANYCNLYENRVLNNYDIGIFLYYSSNNSIKDNNVSSNGEGIFLDSSSHNMVSRNNIHNNDARAIYLHSSLNNVIDNNVSLNNESGVELYHSQDNILRNNILKNKLGVTLVDSQNNIVFLNNFVNTVYNYVLIDSTNLWSSTEKITYTYNSNEYTNYLGNYWSDYTGSDANEDGIGDTPYSVNGDQDNYPLMSPFKNYSSTEDNPPTIEIISPSDGETVSGTVRFSSYVTDDHGLEKVEFYIDDELKVSHGPFGLNTVGSTCNWDCDTTPGSITYIPDGPHNFKAKAYDTAGQVAVDNISFIVDNIVENQPPVADAGVNQTVNSGQVVWFDGSNSSSPDGSIISYKWDFGDGESDTGCHVYHRFRGAMIESKTYTVTLTVENNTGLTSTDICDITVIPLEKVVEVTHQPLMPIPGVSVFGRMKVLYNWVDEIGGEDVFIVSRVDCSAAGFSGMYNFNFIDEHSRADIWSTPTIHPLLWWDTLLFLGNSERSYGKDDFRDFEFFKKEIYGQDFFEGIEVYSFDVINLLIQGWAGVSFSAGPTFPPPFFKTKSAYFQPDYTEAPEVPVEAPNFDLAHLCSPGEMRVYDSGGRITGLVNGEVKEEIPYSAYNDNTIIILSPVDSYRYEVVGTDEGSYGFWVASVEGREVTTTFTATDIPITFAAVHQYTIDWETLYQGGEGVTVQMDFDGDGTPELNITTDSDFTFVPVTINIEPDTLNLNSKIKWATAYIELPGGYDVVDIDIDTVKLWYEGNSVSAEWGDSQDGTLMVKFNGKEVQDLFPGPVDAATVAVAGELQDDTPFGGNDTIRVIEKP